MAEPTKDTKSNKDTSDGLALIVGGLFVLAMVFATYNYFNSNPTDIKEETKTEEKTETTTEEEKSLTDRIKDFFDTKETEDKKEGDLNGEGAKTTEKTESKDLAETTSDTKSGAYYTWTANDYKSGDITGSSYTVESGDTLWEIAEARYGNGAEWTKILSANSDKIGFLADGQQALIMPGQVLVLN